MNPSTALARVLVDALAAEGVTEFVIAPGSRSAPLAIAALQASQRGPSPGGRTPRLHVRIDERSAGFLALGLAKASGQPVAVVTTSGSAVANLHPAVLEAHQAGVPLVLLTADRPPEMRGVGANQTTDQIKIFGDAVRLFHEIGVPRRETGQVSYWRNVVSRAVTVARGQRSRDPRPVHLNVALIEPLLPTEADWPEPLGGDVGSTRSHLISRAAAWELEPGPRTVVIAGDGSGPDARRLAETSGWPLLAEPSSGARSGPYAIGPYRLLLDRSELGGAVQRVVAYGNPSLSRAVTRLLGRIDLELVVVSARARWPDPARAADLVVASAGLRGAIRGATRAEPDAWLSTWLDAGAAATGALHALLDDEPGLPGPLVARVVSASLGPGSLLFVGSSSPIRDLDLAMHPRDPAGDIDHAEPDEHIKVLANRGVSGIDGSVSTAVGAALAHRGLGRGPALALLGDLTFLHDANGLVLGPDEPRPDLTIVVVNDDGGGLFHTLEPGAPEHAGAFERIFGTPHGVDLAALCAATDTPHVRVERADDLADALGPAAGLRVVEATVDRTRTRALHERIRAAVDAAVDGLAGSTP